MTPRTHARVRRAVRVGRIRGRLRHLRGAAPEGAGEATASRGRRGKRARDESAACRRRAGSAARAREPVSAEVAEGHVAAPEADGARRLSQPDGAGRLHDLRARPASDSGAALHLFSRHDAAACSSARWRRIIGYMLPGFWLARQADEAKEAHRQRPSRCARPADRLRRSRHGPRSGASRRRPRSWPCRTRRSRRSWGSSRPRFAPASLEWRRSRTSPSARRWTTCASSCRCSCRRIGSARASPRRFARRRR